MGFEYGYSVERPDVLVLLGGAVRRLRQRRADDRRRVHLASEQKWGQRSSVVLLLPHGYEGQGPDHSSGRIERFLQLCAENNMTVAQPSTPASHFHLLRRQAHAKPRRPLVVFTPKSMLRLKAAASAVEDFTSGPSGRSSGRPTAEPADVDRVLLCSGQGLLGPARRAQKRGDRRTAIVRLEQLYPLDLAAVNEADRRVPERRSSCGCRRSRPNQGPWPFVALNLPEHLGGRPLLRVSRPASASPAAGSSKKHAAEQQTLLKQSFDR